MRCVILAGGAGTRLKPYTATLPKPLVPIGDYAVLELVIMLLKKNGISHITLAVNHLAHLIQTYFSDGAKWGIKIDYSVEDIPLGTIGPLKLIDDLPENFFVMNGDVLSDIDFKLLFEHHVKNDADITVASKRRENKIDYGVIEKDAGNMIVGFAEKPVNSYIVSMGIYVINKNLLQIVPEKRPYGFDNLIYDCLKLKKRAISYEYHGDWLDIGRPDDYAQAQQNYGNYLKLININFRRK
jgi:NDP-sugar pyrophosphorylase family protein